MSKVDFQNYSEEDIQGAKIGTLLIADNPDRDKATIYLQIRLPVDARASQFPELNKIEVFQEALAQIQSLEVFAMKTRANLLREIGDAQSAGSPPRLGSKALRGEK